MKKADRHIEVVETRFEPVETKPCASCLGPTEEVVKRQGIEICPSCNVSFWVAELLFDSDTTEAEIIPTLALSERMGTLAEHRETKYREAAARELLKEYPSVYPVKFLGGFPVVRFRAVIPEVIRYPYSNLVKRVRLNTLTRFIGEKEVADIYQDVLSREKLPVFGPSPGKIEWEYRNFQLVVDVGALNDIEPYRLRDYSEYPKTYRFSFPMPRVVAGLLRALLGRGQHKNLLFGELLGDYGRGTKQSPDKTIIACVLWRIRGKRGDRNTVSRKGNTAEIVNDLLLNVVEREPLTTSKNVSAWRDAEKIANRFDRARALLDQTQRSRQVIKE
jgi:hypothetical protein